MSVSTNLLAANTSDIETSTAGWTAGTNTTIAQSTRFYTGAHSLQLTATASGTASATTAARVAVTAGTVYTAYAYFANVVAAAGHTATVRVDWYSVSTGGTLISSSSSPASTIGNFTAWQSPPPILIATAPAGATWAAVTIVLGGLAASVAMVVDAIAFGPPASISGNLLSYGTQGVEMDATGWAATINATVNRSQPIAFEGWWALTIAATAAGDTLVQSQDVITVVPGVEYFAYAWVIPPASSLEFRAEIRWYDASNAFISSVSASSYPASTVNWYRAGVIATAPATAAHAKLALRPQATSAGQTWTCDQMALTVSPNGTGNLLGYNMYGAEVSTFGWTATGGTLSRSTAQATDGQASFSVVAAGGGADLTLATTAPIPVTAGQTYVYRPAVYPPSSGADFLVSLAWRDSSGATIKTTSARWVSGATGSWWYTYTADIAPVGAVSMIPTITRSAPAAGETWYWDRMLVAIGGLALTAVPIDGYGAQISVQGLTTGSATTWNLWRLAADGSLIPVRGMSGDIVNQAITGDLAVVEDYEAPLAGPVQYFTRTGTGFYLADPVTIPGPDDPNVLVLKDPSLPAKVTTVVVETAPDWTRASRQGRYDPRGRKLPVIISDVRAGRVGTLTLTTEQNDDLNDLWYLLDPGSTLLTQWPDGWGIDDMYVQVGDVDEKRLSTYAPQEDREWSLPLTEVDRPIGGIVGSATRTWQDVLNTYSTWLDVLTSNKSWLDVLTGVGGS